MPAHPCSTYRRTIARLVLLLCVVSTFTLALATPIHAEVETFDSNGVEIVFLDLGSESGEVVVLVHGFAGNAKMHWGASELLAELTKAYRVLAIDCRGHGNSGKPHEPGAYGIEMVEDIVRLLDHLEIEKAHVVGYSMGALITLKLVATHPDRVLSAVPGGFGWNREEDENNQQFNQQLADSLEKDRSFGPLFTALSPEGTAAPTPDRIKQLDMFLGSMNDTTALAHVVRSWSQLTIQESTLRKNRIPTLLIIGDLDPLKPGVDALDGVMANATIKVLVGADHMTATSHPQFQQHTIRFLREHAATEKKDAAGKKNERAASGAR